MKDFKKLKKITDRITQNEEISKELNDLAYDIANGKIKVRIQIDYSDIGKKFVVQRFAQGYDGYLHPLENDKQITFELKDGFALDFIQAFNDVVEKHQERLENLYNREMEKKDEKEPI